MEKWIVLVKEAKTLIFTDIEEEYEKLKQSNYPIIIHPEKYEKAMKLLEEADVLHPGTPEIQKALGICHDMLEPYFPVQHLAGPALMDGDILQSIPGEEPLEEERFPWILRRKILDSFKQSDKAGMAYTQQVFSGEADKAEKTAATIIQEAKNKVAAGGDPWDICWEALYTLCEVQERLDRGWKGHGPSILHTSAEKLISRLGISGELERDREAVRAHLSPGENILSRTILPGEVDDFIDIFRYLHRGLPGLKKIIDSIPGFGSSPPFIITVFSDGSYRIKNLARENKKKPDMNTSPEFYNNHSLIHNEDFVDQLFLIRVWRKYFTGTSREILR